MGEEAGPLPSSREFLLQKFRIYMPEAGSDEEVLARRVAATGLDSLDLMELLNEIEETFEIRIADDTVEPHTTVADLAAFIDERASRPPS